MIVYNVERSWFTLKHGADGHRKVRGLPPSATLKVEVKDRGDLVALLNAICEPGKPGELPTPPASIELVERAYAPTENAIPDCVPRFLRDAAGQRLWDQQHLAGGTNVPEDEEGQCAEWPRCACGRGGPDLCAVA